ncbi:unnamed protein product [Oikopleura dioica]|uniref:Saccharopine dehydrogenase-like oxidoreductase n=1 Tax=Oikopleura dioica TaxID=34765 RepID=E4YIN6_OIKDI|nr:unnamed protein product [Oikopleura dioica]
MPTFDVVILGATGFTGQWVVKYFNTVAGNEYSWAIAGRNMSKLEEIAAGTTAKCVQVDISSVDTIERAVRDAKLVLNCTGPYRLLGEPVVKACVENGVDYLDISGEPEFIEAMELRYNEAASHSGSIVISACGFDSIPSEIGLNFLRDNFRGELHRAEAFLSINAAIGYCGHATTWDCAVMGFGSQDALKALRSLRKSPRIEYKGKRNSTRSFALHGNRTIPFPGSDASIVRRSQQGFALRDKTPVRFSIYAVVGSVASLMGISFTGLCLSLFSRFSSGRSLLMKFAEFFTFGAFSRKGPPNESIAGTSFDITFLGKGFDEEGNPLTKRATVSGPEPGYDATSKILVSCALTLLEERGKVFDNLGEQGGVSTSALAFDGTHIVYNLESAGLEFKIKVV